MKLKVSIVNRSPVTARGRGPKLTNEIIAATISKEPIETVVDSIRKFDRHRKSNAFMIHEEFKDTDLSNLSQNLLGNTIDAKQFPEFRVHAKTRSLGER